MLSKLRFFVTTNLNELGVLFVVGLFLSSVGQALLKNFDLAAALLAVAALLPVSGCFQRKKFELVTTAVPRESLEYGVGLHMSDALWANCPKNWYTTHQEALSALSAIRFALESIGAEVADNFFVIEEDGTFRIALMYDNKKVILGIEKAWQGVLL